MSCKDNSRIQTHAQKVCYLQLVLLFSYEYPISSIICIFAKLSLNLIQLNLIQMRLTYYIVFSHGDMGEG